MDWNLPWRKTLILSTILSCSFFTYSEPLPGRIHNKKWDINTTIKNSGSLESKNPYKDFYYNSFQSINEEWITYQFNKKDKKAWSTYLQITFKRLAPYRDFIMGEIEKAGVPFELCYLPIVESSAHNMAVSSRGATGMWQFMANSSEAYDMYVTEWIDERRDFTKATRGAIQKLSYNYRVLGDWLLALAAYNCGLNRVKTTIKTTGVTDYWELSRKGLLPRETRTYVAKLINVSRLLQDKNLYSVPINWERSEWEEIRLDTAIDLRLLAESSNTPYEILKKANMELNYNITPPGSEQYNLKVPVNYSDNINNALKNNKYFIEFYQYKVKSGDTLSEIGEYYGLSVKSLIKYNPGVSARTLRIGKTLMVPAIKKVDPYRKEGDNRPFRREYTVGSGDTLWAIAMKYKTTVEEIALHNGLSLNGYIRKGMKLKVP